MVHLKDSSIKLGLSKINSIQAFNEDFWFAHILCTDLGNLQDVINILSSP